MHNDTLSIKVKAKMLLDYISEALAVSFIFIIFLFLLVAYLVFTSFVFVIIFPYATWFKYSNKNRIKGSSLYE